MNAIYLGLFANIKNCFYKKTTTHTKILWTMWLTRWLTMIRNTKNPNESYKSISDNMKKMSPIFVPREWMLRDAYEKANKGDFSVISELYLLL